MNPGKLNRRLTVQARTMTQDDAGGREEAWVDSFDCWGELVTRKQGEAIKADSDRNEDTSTFRIRYKAGLTSGTHRILYQLRFYDILGIVEEGIKTSLLVECRAIQSIS